MVWYRLHVKVAPNETGLALQEFYLDSAFEIYVNGKKLMTTGSVSPFKPSTFDAYLIKRFPDADVATGSLVIALRVHISPSDWAAGFPGLYSYNLTMGQEHALSDSTWLNIIGLNSLGWFGAITGFGLGIVALALFVAQSHQREYLWIFLLFLTGALRLLVTFYRYFHNGPSEWVYLTTLFQIAALIFLTRTFFALLRVRFGTWIRIVLGVVIACMLIGAVATVHGTGSEFFNLLSFAPQGALFAGVIPVLVIVHLRRGNHEAGILLVPAILNALTIYLNIGFYICTEIPAMARTVQRVQTAIFYPTVGPFTLDLNNLSTCLFVLSLAVIIVLRSTRMSRQQAFIESEMAAAREVQQIILPEQLERVPGFSIESAYVPAQQVGGDFYQILPAPEGSLFLVIGDVAGKGLPAAMLVSVLVGAIRGVAEYTSEPAELLANLNQRLVGRVVGSISTALAARIFPDGSVVLSNAGHLPPYLDGQEVAISGALPLGAKAGTHYETMRFQMPRGSRLTFYSDGIVEAQNPKGELFGFERSRANLHGAGGVDRGGGKAVRAAGRYDGHRHHPRCGRRPRCPGAESLGPGAGAGELGVAEERCPESDQGQVLRLRSSHLAASKSHTTPTSSLLVTSHRAVIESLCEFRLESDCLVTVLNRTTEVDFFVICEPASPKRLWDHYEL